MPRSAKEQVDITALLKGILNGYPGNTAIFREYLQNSDDAKATKQIFMLDERQHPIESLCDPSLRDSQGPAVLAYNDGVLSERDWEALRKIHSSSKKTDETQTGKNGLGFRASYHLTENPHILSGETLMILDPHHRFDEHPGGMSIDVMNEGANYRDQLEPFSDLMGDDFSPGTVFRLPLRTEKQAKASKIKDTPTSVEQIRTLLLDFCNAELEQVVLFLKHITRIEICHVDAGGHLQVIGSVSIEDVVPAPSSRGEVKFRNITFQREDGSTTGPRSWCYGSLAIGKDEAGKVVSERLGYDVGDSLIADKLLPSIELATPVNGEAITGSLFTLLPLPIKTSFPVHLNAVFALTPDRQGLKNIEEVGTIESRERRLVEWNKVIFEVWTPCAWADLLEELSSSNAPWCLWPPEEKHVYWNNLTVNLMKEVLRRNSPVFPVASDVASFLSLDNSSVLISPPSLRLDFIRLLTDLGVKIVRPPAHIFAILESHDVSFAARILSPETLHGVLEAGYQHDQWHPYDPKTVSEIIEYLGFSTSSPSLGNLIGLPWFVQPDGSSLTFQRPGVGLPCIIPSSEEEAHLFGLHLQMLAWAPGSSFSDKLLSALRNSGTSSILNATLLQPCHVIDVLSRRFTQHDVVDCDPDSSDLAWILAFWTWLEGWRSNLLTNQKNSMKRVWKTQFSALYLLPITPGRLRRPSERAVHFTETESALANAWEKFGVPVLHHGVSSRAIVLLSKAGFIEKPDTLGFIPFLLNNANPLLQHTALDDDFDSIRRSLYSAIISQRLPPLTIDQRKVLEHLNIFSIRDAGETPSVLKSIHGNRIQVDVSGDFPLPVQHPPVIYVDLRDSYTKTFIQMLEPIKATGVLNLLCIAVDQWHLQSLDLQDRFIDLIFDNWRKLPQLTQEKLTDLPFVTVNGTQCRVPPKNLVHPRASITPLFEGEVGRIPVGRFAAAPLVATMRSLGFLPDSLDKDIVQNRLHYICNCPSEDQKIFDKAKTFVRLLDRQWEDSFQNYIHLHQNLPWLPATPPDLCSPSNSRDQHRDVHSDPVFYDLVLTVLPRKSVRIANRDFRSALGWSNHVSTDILVRQLSRTISLPEGEDRYKRLSKMIAYLSLLHNTGQFSSDDLMSIRSEVAGHSWIPIFGSNIETVVTEHAVLSGGDLKPPFRHVYFMESHSFLMAMGCTKRPTLAVLVLELQKCDVVPDSDMPAVTALLQEIATNHPSFDRTTISIPGQSGRLHPIDRVYYCDTDCILPSALQDKVATHSTISRSLSDQLGISCLTSLLLDLGEDEFDDSEQMGEDLVDRIQGFLKEHDIKYAFNEFLGNADDAHAGELSVLLDRRHHPYKLTGLISPAFREVQEQNSIVLFNDAVLSDEDFKGLRKVGRGGKGTQLDTHGRHGLGALSFYYFTNVVTVISGAYVMILDPSGRYLPPSRGQKRTSLVRKITNIYSHYPNQLQPYETLFKFSKDTTFYQGTLFCLPLNTDISVKPCDAESANKLLENSYRDLAQNAFFFTGLEKISARVRADQYETSERYIWSFSACRRVPQLLGGHGLSYRLLEITSARGRLDETWMVATSEGSRIPENHKTTAMGLKLTKASLVVQLAIRLKPVTSDQMKFYLFSTLRLPSATSFPFHLNARFAISSSRQGIVFDSPDKQKTRDPKSDFNAWILTEVVPPLYLSSLTHVIQHRTESHILPHKRWWLLKPAGDISRHASRSFHTLLVNSDSKVFKSTDEQFHSFGDAVFTRGGHDNLVDIVVNALGLLKTPRLVTEYALTGLTALENATTVNEAYVRSVLSEMTLEKVQHLYMDGTIKLEDLLALLRYIRQETPLDGLPLLVLSTNLLVLIPGALGQRIYFSDDAAHADLFESAAFLHPAFCTDRTLHEIWSSPPINVVKLTNTHTAELIINELGRLSDEGKEGWLKKFWGLYKTLPGPPPLSSLEAAEVKLVRGSLRHYSLHECQQDRVIYVANSKFRKELSPGLRKLGIDTVKPTRSTELKLYLDKRFTTPLVNVLMCLSERSIIRFDDLPAEEAGQLKDWLTSSIETGISTKWRRSDPGIDRTHLSRLQIWPAHSSQGLVVCSASELAVLPSFFSIEALIPYLRPNCLVAKHSHGLIAVIAFWQQLKDSSSSITMSPQQILDSVEIPSMITDHAPMDIFGNFLRYLFDFPSQTLLSVSTGLKIFDVDGRACPVQALYDHTVPLFSAALAYTSSFVHPRLRNLGLNTLHSLGLNHEISFTTFRTCVERVQAELQRHVQDGTPTRDQLFNMSRVAFECYNDTLPRLIMRRSGYWAALDCIAFVRAKDIRRQGASYPADDFCKSRLPVLLAPSQCVLPSLEPIAWTQRALFFEEPNDDVTAVNMKLGVPEVHEVVAHLKILTTEIAPKHLGNSTLLSDIRATYKWLNHHAEEAQEYMVLLEGEKLFLNVDDPDEDWWDGQWSAAGEMVLHLSYDFPSVKRVRRFLQDYPDLLRIAGCSTMSVFSRDRLAPDTNARHMRNSDMLKIFDEMRKGGEIIDLSLVPTADAPEELLDLGSEGLPTFETGCQVDEEAAIQPSERPLELSAHRVVLAASIPYIRDWAKDWKHGTSDGVKLVGFNGTLFGAKAVLNFVYTGDFGYTSIPRSDDFEGLQHLLSELLALLPIADEWDMPDLKAKIESEIIHKHDLVQRLLPFHEKMLQVAERYNANNLKDALNEMARHNGQLLKRLSMVSMCS